MTTKVIRSTVLASLVAMALSGPGQLLAEEYQGCTSGTPVSVKGKIFNNGQTGGGFHTLGVVWLNGDSPVGKMKCGIVGIIKDVPSFPSLPNFTHTISCDDDLEANLPIPGSQIVHSQLAFNTEGYTHVETIEFCNGADPSAGVSSSFTEHSRPRPGEGRGVFTTVTDGLLTIKGTISCLGTIDMKFKGEVCMD